MREIDFNDAQQALAFLTPQLLRIETTVYETRYPAFTYDDLLYVNTDGDMWDAGVVFYSGDIAGKAEFFSARSFDMPYADVSQTAFMQATHMAAIGYEWSRGELERSARLGRNLTSEKAIAAGRIAQRFLYGIAVSGSVEKNWYGLINWPTVPASNAPFSFTAGTPEQVLSIINGAIAAPSIATNNAYNTTSILMPTTAIRDLASRLITNTTQTLLAFIQANNSLTLTTGQPLSIRGMMELENAGAVGTRRMVTYEESREVAQFALPGPHEFVDPFRKSSLSWEVAGIMNTGGTDVRVPKAIKYTDAI